MLSPASASVLDLMARTALPACIERKRRHREAMELALAEGLSLDAARRRLSAERYERMRAEIQARRSAEAGNPFPERDAPDELASTGPRPLPWWQGD